MQPSNHKDLDGVRQAKGEKIVHVNVRSLLPNFDEIKYNFLDGTFDIVALSET